MGEQFILQVPYVALMNPDQYLLEVNDQLRDLAEKGKANILFRAISSLDRNIETGKWYIEGLLSAVAGEAEDIDIYDCELDLPQLDILLAGPLNDDKKNIVEHPRYVKLLQIPELITNIKGWSTARGILENGLWYSQATKMYEEDGEVAPGVAKNKRNLIIDGVGDMIVVMVNLLELSSFNAVAITEMVARMGKESTPAGNAHYLYHKLRMSNTLAVDYLWEVAGIDSPKQITREMFDEDQIKCVVGHLTECIYYAIALANAYEFTLEQALSLAWDEIKDRTGFLNADGVFVKESDMTENDRIQRALKETEKAGDFDGDTGPTIKVELSVAEQLKDYDGDVQSGGVPTKTVEVSYFPVDLAIDQVNFAIDACAQHANVQPGEVTLVRAGLYYGGATQHTKPHVLFEFLARGAESSVVYSGYGDEYFKLTEDAASYQVLERQVATH
ncbi:hypothetical protein pEaSNUABM11_00266 [Erwinia phage pEa_SNUABM_11]|nr:hypothetical protein pEaSNUABM11_00266 [Erwinia phage pEa_SNUABM_11]